MSTNFQLWRKSSHSEANGACLEVAHSASGTISIRDSKQGSEGPILDFTRHEWAAFIRTFRTHD